MIVIVAVVVVMAVVVVELPAVAAVETNELNELTSNKIFRKLTLLATEALRPYCGPRPLMAQD